MSIHEKAHRGSGTRSAAIARPDPGIRMSRTPAFLMKKEKGTLPGAPFHPSAKGDHSTPRTL